MRRYFRVGLRLGLLIGVAFAIVKTVQARRPQREAAPDAWRPLTDTPPPAAPVDEVGEPVLEPAAPPPATPPAPAPAKPAAEVEATAPAAPEAPVAKKASPTKKAAKKAAIKAVAATKAAKTGAEKATKAAKTTAKNAAETTVKKAAEAPGRAVAWIAAEGATCPPSHPVKAKLSSQLYRIPGMLSYDRMRADRCYVSEDGAVADGFTRAPR